MKKALICGVSGQDGAYLSRFLLDKGYEVYGGSRDAQSLTFNNLKKLNIRNSVRLLSINLHDFRSVLQNIMWIKPDEIYNLSGQSSVGLSFEQPVETFDSIILGTINLLESIRFSTLPIRLYSAGSSECFGDTKDNIANEETPFRPRSPYAVAKSTAFWQVANYREAYDLFACTGILFNHESPLRSDRFVTKKIISTACRIFNGSKEKLVLGNIEIERDWGWAPDYVEAMWLMLQHDFPDDYVIATGETHKLRDFINLAFKELALNWEDHVLIDKDLYRPTDLKSGRADPSKAKKILGWNSKCSFEQIIRNMIDDELMSLKDSGK
uniref:GDP-mannose 4,6-dehydratase n=1 Tax=Bacteroidota TaxID=976 RepID=UPI004047323F